MYCYIQCGRTYDGMMLDSVEAICKKEKCLYLSKSGAFLVVLMPILILPCMGISYNIVFGVYSGFKLVLAAFFLVFVTICIPLVYYNYKYVLCLVTGRSVYIKSIQTMYRLRCIPVESIVEYSVVPASQIGHRAVKIVTRSPKYAVSGVKNIEELFPVLDALHVKRKFSNWGWY